MINSLEKPIGWQQAEYKRRNPPSLSLYRGFGGHKFKVKTGQEYFKIVQTIMKNKYIYIANKLPIYRKMTE